MKAHILSDLHIEFEDFAPLPTDADVVILAGDIHVGKKSIEWIKTRFPDQPVIYVLGNHEYYGRAFPKHIHDLKQLVADTNIHLLENDRLVINEVTFLGCTLWTNFKLFGEPQIAGYEATQTMTDYRKIRVSPDYRKLRSVDTAIIHQKSLSWLSEEVKQLKAMQRKVVIVTHHAPSKRSIPHLYQEDMLSAAYASHLDPFVANSHAALWVHGHVHSEYDYAIGSTRVICNPRGYPDEPNERFIPDLVIEV
ncbi:metallophosphoesterase [Acaryochloris sp. CCMEE 5410]|uniref:metallophosphoesterase n=1 Tax=Acaryochloris sp. CCMEE 5410 TaxID=310037 RepID=UPI0002483B26|nr:metallophosphoesterase [Acaryochloris sp. CCMEE 5410]KAI9133244.1 metallophosphoesterase [Acaryochloris sp. CCMEE 5410]